MDNINDEIRQYILAKYLRGETAANLPDDAQLRTSGILDSVAILQLVRFLEERYGIEVEAHEMDNFDTIENIAAFVESKRA
jgi:acyl carrier protein